VILPLQSAGLLGGLASWSDSAAWLVWMPMLAFEVALALWLLIKGVAVPTRTAGAQTWDAAWSEKR
jgi:hypothetical protein